MKKFPTLYKRNSNGKIQEWTIWADGGSYFTREGLQGGKLTEAAGHTCEPKNPGKKNATTAEQQAEKEAEASWDKKLKKGYMKSVADVDKTTFKKPMKGYKWKEQRKNVVFPVYIDDKLNGIRCQNEADAAKSTGGEIFYTIPHIRAALAPVFEKYPEAFIDGEAFNYKLRKNLNRLVELVAVTIKPKDLTPELLAESEQIVQLHVFDGWGFKGITKETHHLERRKALVALFKEFPSKYIFVLKSEEIKDEATLLKRLAATKPEGGEGLMVRWGACPFKHGKSPYMLKLKHFDDDEFEILDIQEGNADWKGCAKRIVLKLPEPCTDRDGKVMTDFAANIEGDREWLRRLFENKKQFIGEQATTEYQQLSEYGIPQLPWVRAIRNYE